MLIKALEGHEVILALVLVALFAGDLIFQAIDRSYRRRAEKKFLADADRINEMTEERDAARDDAFELRLSLEKANARIRDLEHEVEQLKYDKKQLTKWGEMKNV